MGSEQPMVIYNTTAISATTTNIPLFLNCFERVTLIVHSTAVSGTSPTLDAKFQYKAPREGSDWVDVASGAITQITAANQTQSVTLENAALISEDMRLVLTIGGSATPTVTADISITAVT